VIAGLDLRPSVVRPEEPWLAVAPSARTGACLNITVENADGTKRRIYFYGRTQAEARVKVAAVRERVGRGEPVRDATRTVSDWLAEWRTTFLRASDRAESTKDLYAGLTVGHVEPVIGHLALGQVKPSDITRVLLRMEQLGRAASTRRSAYAVLRSAFEDAVIDGLLGASPVLRVKRPRATHGEATSLEPEQVAQLLQGAEDLRYARVLRLILGTGLRRGEALALRWADMRLDRCELSIRGSLTRRGSELVVSDAKTQRSRRVVSLSPAMVRLISEQRAEQAAERLQAGNLWNDSGFVFATEFGCPVDPRNLLRTARIAAKRAGLPQIGVHTLRHTYATTALLNNVPMHVVSRNLGHSSIMITADIYGHLTDDAARSAALVVSDALNL
jgi:integrase